MDWWTGSFFNRFYPRSSVLGVALRAAPRAPRAGSLRRRRKGQRRAGEYVVTGRTGKRPVHAPRPQLWRAWGALAPRGTRWDVDARMERGGEWRRSGRRVGLRDHGEVEAKLEGPSWCLCDEIDDGRCDG